MARRRFGRTLTARAVLVTCAVAVVSVLVTALVAFPIAMREADRDASVALDREAALVAALIGPRLASPRTRDEETVLRRVTSMHIDVYLIRDGEPDRPGLPRRVVDLVTAGRTVPAHRAAVGGVHRLVAGRPLPNRTGVVLTQEPDSSVGRGLTRRLGLALLAGLAAGLVAGALLARRLVGPIRHAALAASRLSAGDRTVRVAVDAPAEVEDLARALNDLAKALATSEGRQRDFLLSISHELRTPLTTIRGYAEALADGVIGPDGAMRAGQTVLGEAELLARLEAADFPVELLPVDLTDLVRTAADAWAARCAGVGLVLRTELPGGPVQVRTDPGRLRQVIDGLLENALRVVPPGAPVVLAVRTDPASAVVEVRDGGPGFTDDDLAVAFERGALYQRYQGVRAVGSGLGL